MIRAGSAQSLAGMGPVMLNDLVGSDDQSIGFPVSGDRTALDTPFWAKQQGCSTLGRIIAETHEAKAKAGEEQREKANHTP